MVCDEPFFSFFTDVLSICLWNLYVFYQQFSVDVAKKLSDDSAPIFKKLKEFVSIAKWHDITYWSVKQAIEKSHRTLLKFIKEYEVIFLITYYNKYFLLESFIYLFDFERICIL